MSAICPVCSRLVPIRVVRIEGFRYIYRPHAHDDGEKLCNGGEIR